MVELTVQSLKAQNIKKAGLLATDGTIAGGVFKESLKNAGIESVLPVALSQKSLMALIYRIKAGKEPDMAAFNRILQELVSGGAERIVLGCTEISILNLKEKCPCAVPYTDCMELLAEAAVLLATAPKSNSAHNAIIAAMQDIERGGGGDIPRHLKNVHADSAGSEKPQAYKYPHVYPKHYVKQRYLPESLGDTTYYEYADNKTEQAAKHYWDLIKGGGE